MNKKDKNTPQQRLKVYSVRMDADQMHLASFHGIDTGSLFRQALKEALAKRDGKCPTCGQKLKWEKVQ